MFNELICLQIGTLLTLYYFIRTYNLLTLWYLGGIYLVLLGSLGLLDDGDIFIGFLWVIDLGVGLIFFIFILHYSTFLHSRNTIDKTSREAALILLSFLFLTLFYFFFATPVDLTDNTKLFKTWYFLVSWYDYYDFFYSYTVTDLNLLREIFFYNNSLEFYIINFMLLFGILSAILLSFLVKRFFMYLNYHQFVNTTYTQQINATYFIRNQNFLKQQITSTGTRVWTKKKSHLLNDF